MKKKTLVLAVFLTVLGSKAQDHTWNFSDASWVGYAGYSSLSPATTTIDGLTLISGGSVVGANSASVVTYADLFASTTAADIAGVTLSGVIPTKRGFSFPVTGPCTVKVWAVASSTNRIVSVSDGTAVVGSLNLGASPYKGIVEAVYTGGAGTLYVYCNNTAKIAKIQVITTLGTKDFKTNPTSTVYTEGKDVFVANVKSNTKIAVYALTGALVKTIETNFDTSFNLESGVWIAKITTADGEQAVKLIIP